MATNRQQQQQQPSLFDSPQTQPKKTPLVVTLRRVGLKKFQVVIDDKPRYQGVAFSRARIEVMLASLERQFALTIREVDSRH